MCGNCWDNTEAQSRPFTPAPKKGKARTKLFRVNIRARNEFLADLPDAGRGVVEEQLRRRLSVPILRGPRGGAYVPFGEIEIRSSDAVNWMTDETVLQGRRMGKYVRPHHATIENESPE
jgi:hypothetical protein